MSAGYKRMLKLLEKWPVDKNKKGGDLAAYIRTEVQKAFGERKFDVNSEQCDKTYLSLKRIIEDHHFNTYKRNSTSSATGLTAEQCKQILEPEFLEALEQQDKGVFRRIFSTKS